MPDPIGEPSRLARRALHTARTALPQDDPARELLRSHEARLTGPLRIALAGKVKAGKSTLVNALIGDELAPTDAGECTMVTTWYQHGRVPATRVVPKRGEVRELPFRRREGRFVVDLGGLSPDQVSRVEVDWPSPLLEPLTLIDTPGIDSLTTEASERTTDLLTPSAGNTVVDAVIYLMRFRHRVDLSMISELGSGGPSGAVTTVAVLSRADEVGGGRLDSLLSARDVAARHAADPTMRSHVAAVLPVAGLLAKGARMLRHDDFTMIQRVAGLDRDVRETALISADRFCADPADLGDPAQRRSLVERLGLFGVRLGAALVRQGYGTAGALADELARRSGLGELEKMVHTHFLPRSQLLKSLNAVVATEQVAPRLDPEVRERVLGWCDEFRAGTHGLAEMAQLVRLRQGQVEGLSTADRNQAMRVLGDRGLHPWQRLGLVPEATGQQVERSARLVLGHWRDLGQDPAVRRPTRELARTVVRSAEELVVKGGAAAT